MLRWLSLLGLGKAGAAKADPTLLAIAVAVISSAAAPAQVLGDTALLLWLFVGSCCGVCFTLFGDEAKALTWRALLSKLSLCFGPGFCLTGIGIKLSGLEPSAELVLALSLILSVASPVLVPILAKRLTAKAKGAE